MNLCFSGTIIILIIILLLELEIGNYDEDGNEILFTHQLRGMYAEEKNNYIQGIVNRAYNSIYSGVIKKTKEAKNEYYFTIMCREIPFRPIEYCVKHNGYQEWLNYNHIEYNIQPTVLSIDIINKLNKVFPDSNITHSYKNCCDYYKITW